MPEESVKQGTSEILSCVIEGFENVKHNNNNELKSKENNNKWIDQVKEFKSLVEHVSSFAHHYDFSSDIQYKGCRTYLKMAAGYSRALSECYDRLSERCDAKEDKKLSRLIGQCHCFIVMGRSLSKYHLLYEKHRSPTMYSSDKFAHDLVDLLIEHHESLTDENACQYFHVKYFGLWLPKWVRKVFKSISLQLFFASNPLNKSLFGIFSKRKLNKFCTHAALNFQVRILKQPTESFFNGKVFALSMWTWNKMNSDILVSYHKLLDRQSSWYINKDTKQIEHVTESPADSGAKKKVKCVLLQPRTHNCKDLILFIHGGAFVSMTAASIIPLLQPIVRATQTPVLSVDYTLAPEAKFPIACQEILDVYLNLLGDNSIIGYTPERIIVSGESAGAHFSLTLAISVAEVRNIQQQSVDANVQCTPLPHAVHAIYPVSSVTVANLFPSRFIVDYLIQATGFLPIFNAYCGPIEEDVSKGNLNYQMKPWYKNNETLRQATTVLNSQVDNALVNPVGYEHFDRLDTVPLYLTVGEFDPLLDDSITIAKVWKGPVTLDVIPDSPHGLVTFEYFAPKDFAGGKLTRQRFVQSLSRQSSTS